MPSVAAYFVSNADENWLTRMQAVKYWIGYQFLKNLENAFDHVMCLSGCLTLYKREALLAVDHDLESRTFLGDEVKYGEDRFLTRKLVERARNQAVLQRALLHQGARDDRALPQPATALAPVQYVDFITAIPHLNRFNPVVLVHYISIALLLFFYPLFLVSQIIHLGFVIPMLEHALLVTVFALAYELNKQSCRNSREHPASGSCPWPSCFRSCTSR